MPDMNDFMNFLFGQKVLRDAPGQMGGSVPPMSPGGAPAPNNKGLFATPSANLNMGDLAQQQQDISKGLGPDQISLDKINSMRKFAPVTGADPAGVLGATRKPAVTIIIPKGKK